MPNLNQQETVSILAYLQFSFRLFRQFSEAEFISEGIMVEKSTMVLTSYLELLEDQKKHERELALWSPIVVTIFQEILTLDWEGPFGKHLPGFFKIATLMLMTETTTVRKVIQDFMLKITTKYFA